MGGSALVRFEGVVREGFLELSFLALILAVTTADRNGNRGLDPKPLPTT